MSKKLHVALLFGGRSAEHEVSVTSASAIYTHLDPDKYQVTCLYVNREGQWRRVESPLAPEGERVQGEFASFLPWAAPVRAERFEADVYFPVLHGPFGEDGTVQGLFEMADAAYVGAPVLGSAVGMDKAVAKSLFLRQGLPVGGFDVIFERDWRRDPEVVLRLMHKDYRPPFFVKPANLGSSVGISRVNAHTEAEAAVETAFQFDRKILVEEGILGREIECSVLGNDEPRASLPGEVIPFREFYDYRDKYIEGKTRFGIPADLPDDRTAEIRRLALEAFKAVDACGMARVDFFVQAGTDRVYLNEVNTIPGFTQISMYPKLWEASGLGFGALLDELIRLGLERHEGRKRKVEKG
jgi:D-alanine-D-alanine ligase